MAGRGYNIRATAEAATPKRAIARANSYLALAGLAVIVATSAFLRYQNLAINPGWDGDEGYNINIAWNLAQGKLQMFATSYAFVQHPPLFYAMLAAIFKVTGPGILGLRLLSSSCGVLTTIALFYLGKSIGDEKTGLYAAVLFAIYPVAVLQNRWGYTYNLLMLVATLTALFAWQYVRRATDRDSAETSHRGVSPGRWLIAAAVAAGLGMISDQEGIFLIGAVLLCVLVVDRSRIFHALAAALALPALYAITMFILRPTEFVYDWQYNVGRVSDGSALVTVIKLAVSYERFLGFDYWLPLGILGIFLIADRRARGLMAVFTLVALLFILLIRDPNPYFRTAVPILPFVCLGLAVLVTRATEYLFRWWSTELTEYLGPRWQRARSLGIMSAVFVVLYVPLTMVLATDIVDVQSRLPTRVDNLANSPRDAQRMANFVNASTERGDLVVVSSLVSWLLKSHTVDLLQAVAAEGKGTAFYPANMPASRFVYEAHYDRAKFIVMDNFSRAWAKEMPEEGKITQDVTAHWPTVFTSGEYVVYRNPKYER